MARGHGRILTSVWEDQDFLALTQGQQRMYLFLISQPNLNHAGLLPLTLRRWARKAADVTFAEIDEHLAALEEARFIVTDDETEELLVRTFVRNDGVWRQPKVMAAMVSGAEEISSGKLRRALLDEMTRIPVDQLSDAPGARGAASVREQVTEHLMRLRKVLGATVGTPPEAGGCAPEDDEQPIEEPSESLPEGYAEPSDTPPEGTTRADVHARVSAGACAPSPAPAPAPEKKGGASASDQAAPPTEPPRSRPDGRHPIPDDFCLTPAMRRISAKTFPDLDLDYEMRQFIRHHRAEGTRKRNWPEEWTKWLERSAKWASERGNPQGSGYDPNEEVF